VFKRPDVCEEHTVSLFMIIGVALGKGARGAIASLPIFFFYLRIVFFWLLS